MKKISIIGGGITGLTSAYRLARAGHEVEVFEKSEELGGLGGSLRRGEFIFDYGPHEFCTENPLLVASLKDILKDDLLIREKSAAQYFEGKYVDYPLPPQEILSQLSPQLVARVGFEVFTQRLKSIVWTVKDHSFESWVSNRFGSTLYNIYFKPFTQKVWGVDPENLDPRTASSRISFNSIFDYLIKAIAYFFGNRNDFESIHSPLKKSFYYSRGGIGILSEKLAQRCRELGVKFKTGYTLEKIEYSENRVNTLKFTNGEQVKNFDYAISTIPLTHMLTCFGKNNSSMPIKFRSMVFVFLEIPQKILSEYSWIYFPDKEVCFQRITDFAHFKAGLTPDGKTGVCLEISCFKDDETWSMKDHEINSKVRSDLERVGLLRKEVQCTAHIVRKHFIYPIQINGYLELVQELLDPIRGFSNFVTTGRQGLFKYCNMNECMEMAIDIAEQIENEIDEFTYDLSPRWLGAGLEKERV